MGLLNNESIEPNADVMKHYAKLLGVDVGKRPRVKTLVKKMREHFAEKLDGVDDEQYIKCSECNEFTDDDPMVDACPFCGFEGALGDESEEVEKADEDEFDDDEDDLNDYDEDEDDYLRDIDDNPNDLEDLSADPREPKPVDLESYEWPEEDEMAAENVLKDTDISAMMGDLLSLNGRVNISIEIEDGTIKNAKFSIGPR